MLVLIPGITGDGRCLFRSVAYGACIRSGKPSPSEKHQKELADELRSKVSIIIYFVSFMYQKPYLVLTNIGVLGC